MFPAAHSLARPLWVAGRGGHSETQISTSTARAPSLADRLAWIALAAIPSGLVIAVTAYVTMDVAAAPFFWVLPLALYLLTFVALFVNGHGSAN